MGYPSHHCSSKRSFQSGFTIVELVVVVVVIAFLAAVTIVAYNGISKRATTALLQSDLDQAAKTLENDKTLSGDGTYPTDLLSANNGKGLRASNGATYQYSAYNTLNPKGFCLTETVGTSSQYVDQSGTIKPNGCPGHNANGVAAITNYQVRAGGSFSVNPATDYRSPGNGSTGTYGYAQGFKYTANATQYNQSYCEGSSPSPLTPGSTYTFSGYAKLSWSGTKIRMQLKPYLTNGGLQTAISAPTPTDTATPNVWQRYSMTYTLPSTIGYIYPCLQFALSGSSLPTLNSTAEFADFMITEGSTLYTFANGNTPGWLTKPAFEDPNFGTLSGPSIGVPLQ